MPAREASIGASPQARSNLALVLESFAKCRPDRCDLARSPAAALWRPGSVEQRLYLVTHLIVISVPLLLRFGTRRT
jgi:hypothetical protein